MLSPEEKAKRRQHYKDNKDIYKQKAKEWKAANPEKLKLSQKKNWLKSEYGLNWEEFLNKYNGQEGKCDICGTFLELMHTNKTKQPFVDHCHKTGQIRGLLCHHCNMGIGNFKENQTNLDNAKKYLSKWES